MSLDLATKKVLITGMDSFTGAHLSLYLENQGYLVFGTVIQNGDGFKTFTCNITSKEECLGVIAALRPDYVIHLAGISFVGHIDIEAFYKVNTLGTQNILDALIEAQCYPQKVILASSATVYGEQGCEILDETMCPMPTNHYGISKLAMEHMARSYFKKLPILIARPFNYTGVGQSEHFLIPKIVAHFKRKVPLIELGNLNIEREFNDVVFTCKVYERLLSNPIQSEIINLCSGKAISLTEIIATMNTIAHYKIAVEINPVFVRSNEIKRLVGSTMKLQKAIGNIELTSINDTLRSMYEA